MNFFKQVSWKTFPILALTLFGAIAGLAFYIPRHGVHPVEPLFCLSFVYLIAFVISAGYHRYFAHKTFQAHPALKIFYLILGCAGLQESAIVWASDHRFHHRYIDTDRDPYNIQKGFWWAHVGWLLAEDPASRRTLFENVPDLAQDPWIRWQHRYWLWISLPLAVGIPLAIGFAIGRPGGMLLWGVLLRIAITHHSTFLINSAAHRFGKQPYSDANSARDVWWLIPFLCGENYHNYHHHFPSDYRNGIHWYQWDPSKWVLWICSKIGLAKDLQRVPAEKVFKARLAMDFKRAEQRLKMEVAENNKAAAFEHLRGLRQTLSDAAELYARARRNYRQFRSSKVQRSQEALRLAQANLRERRDALNAMATQWRDSLRIVLEA